VLALITHLLLQFSLQRNGRSQLSSADETG